MKNRIKLFEAIRRIAIIAMVAIIGFSMTACDNDKDGGDGGKVPEALQGNWLRDSEGTERHLKFTKDGWGTKTGSFDDVGIYKIVTSATDNKIEWEYKQANMTGSFEYTISGPTLTITRGGSHEPASDGDTFTKQ